MFRVISLAAIMLMLSSCNGIDGHIRVFTDFMLTDDEDCDVMLTTGMYEAEFEYDARDHEVELEIDDVYGDDDHEFEFQVPVELSSEDFRKEKLELSFALTHGDREIDTRMLITNVIYSKKGPIGEYRRCREHGSAVYFYQPIVYYRYDRRMHIAAHFSSAEETLAMFEASERIKDRHEVWRGECGGEMPADLSRF